MKKLYYTFHERFIPMTYKAVISEPYNFKDVRKLVDGCAFNLYGHWVKKTQDQNQNRTALFENTMRNEIIKSDMVDGQVVIPTMAYGMTPAFIPKRTSFSRRTSSCEQYSPSSSSVENWLKTHKDD